MKKLMIAAAVAAMTAGAFAECQEVVTNACPFGYQIKVLVRTTKAESQTYKISDCQDGVVCYRNPTVRRFAGFIYGFTDPEDGLCGANSCCNEWDGAKLVLWDYDSHAAAKVTSWNLLQLDRVWNNANDRTTFEMAFGLGFEDADNGTAGALYFAGFGKVGQKYGNWTIGNASGFCAGQLPAPVCVECVTEDCEETCTGTLATVWNICNDEIVEDTPVSTVAYGKWTLVWDAKVAKYASTAAEDEPLEIPDWEHVEPVTIGGAN